MLCQMYVVVSSHAYHDYILFTAPTRNIVSLHTNIYIKQHILQLPMMVTCTQFWFVDVFLSCILNTAVIILSTVSH